MKRRIDLSDIKENDIDKTSSFTDLMTRKERRLKEKDDIEDMIKERKKSTADLTLELDEARKQYNKINEEEKEDNLGKTQILELTRQMKFNFEESKKENVKKKKHGISVLNVIGEVNLLCIGYYIYF